MLKIAGLETRNADPVPINTDLHTISTKKSVLNE